MKHKGDRETSFIDKKVSTWLEANRDTNGLCLHRFHADLVIDLEGRSVGNVVEIDGRNVGDVVEIDGRNVGDVAEIDGRNEGDTIEIVGDGKDVAIESNREQEVETVEKYVITSIGKRCFAECELLKEKGEPCPLKDGVAFGKPIKE